MKELDVEGRRVIVDEATFHCCITAPGARAERRMPPLKVLLPVECHRAVGVADDLEGAHGVVLNALRGEVFHVEISEVELRPRSREVVVREEGHRTELCCRNCHLEVAGFIHPGAACRSPYSMTTTHGRLIFLVGGRRCTAARPRTRAPPGVRAVIAPGRVAACCAVPRSSTFKHLQQRHGVEGSRSSPRQHREQQLATR